MLDIRCKSKVENFYLFINIKLHKFKMTDQASVQTQPFICGIYGHDKCRRTTLLCDELHFTKN